MNLNLALCLNAPSSMAADVQGALFHLETRPLHHLPQAPSSLVHGGQPALPREIWGRWVEGETFPLISLPK